MPTASAGDSEPVARARLPDQVDVVIVGGGIIGSSAAYFLAKRGVRVALCEKGRIAGEQTRHGALECVPELRRELPARAREVGGFVRHLEPGPEPVADPGGRVVPEGHPRPEPVEAAPWVGLVSQQRDRLEEVECEGHGLPKDGGGRISDPLGRRRPSPRASRAGPW